MYRILISNKSRGINDGGSIFSYHTIRDDSNTIVPYETNSIDDLEIEISKLLEIYDIKSVIPITTLNITNDLTLEETANIGYFNASVEINGIMYNINFNDDVEYINIEQLQVDKPNKVKALFKRNDCELYINDVLLNTNEEKDIEINRISEVDFIELKYVYREKEYKKFIRTLNNSLLGITTAGDCSSEVDGDFYLSFINNPQIIKLDTKGNILFYKIGNNNFKGFIDFKKHIIGDNIYYSYHEYINSNEEIEDFLKGERIILNENYQIIDKVNLIGTDKCDDKGYIDGHGFEMIDICHYIVSSMKIKFVNNIPSENTFNNVSMNLSIGDHSVVSNYIQEIDAGEVIWEFDSIDYPELYSYIPNYDYNNTNLIDPNYSLISDFHSLNENSILISFKNMCSIIKVNKARDEIEWSLSDCFNSNEGHSPDTFDLESQDKFNNQSSFYIRKSENDLMLDIFCNNNNTSIVGGSNATKLSTYYINEDSDYCYVGASMDAGRVSKNYGNFTYINDRFLCCSSGGDTSEYGINSCLAIINTSKRKIFEVYTQKEVIPFRAYYSI